MIGETIGETAEMTALRVLIALVRDEYPRSYSLAEIAATWVNDVTPVELAALAWLDAALADEPRTIPNRSG